MKIVVDARAANAAVDELYKEIESQTPIILSPSNSDNWMSSTINGVTTILVGSDTRPESSLYHELLHADLKLRGYNQHLELLPRSSFDLEIKSIMEMLDNELQHHKMFKKFIGAGFSRKHFYGDDDASAFKLMRARMKKTSSGDVIGRLAIWMTLISPGGMGSEDERRQLKRRLINTSNADVRASLDEVEKIMEEFRRSNDYSPRTYLERIFVALRMPYNAWIGSSQNFPDDGFFVGPPFER